MFPTLFFWLVTLPWASSSEPARTKAAELLALDRITPATLSALGDDRPLAAEGVELLLRVLYRLDRFPPEVLEPATMPLDAARVLGDPSAARAGLYRIAGRVIAVEAVTLDPPAAARWAFPRYFCCRMLLDGQRPAVVFSTHVPAAWLSGSLPADGSAGGLFLRCEMTAGEKVLCFAARRMAWHPAGALGQLGMDIGLFDEVADRKPILPGEREAFYQLLSAVGKARPGQLNAEAGSIASVVPLFNDAPGQRGKLFKLTGWVRRAVRIAVDDADLRARFGFDHYFELALFTEDSQDNPIICCVRRLPAGMPTGDGPQYGEQVLVCGFFFKTWAYRPAAGRGASAEVSRMQLAPLLIADEPVWLPASTRQSGVPGLIGAAIMLAALVLGLVLWRRVRQGEREFRRRFRPNLGGLPSTGATGNDNQPDFTALQSKDRT